ncbi:MoxR-like ATPase [Roseivirga pacifica]|uniref:MoxR-like ATPase n=1 Tax=Roseivirga pacifica TaxID=1267423 RepID=A0A1I0MET6_9BACT|nr:MoxR family ATPase [Roseivirga pacifica]MCO6358823.1 AAA domain-containing protein [Roseivirga pacifica]MCO6365541.1 AAA domain-containing protein [Roseivirga pacifica]MCO6371729.1 AAA domain-containing protein [Roseivirga pacifica]MCO6376160.1 AAA domain-containing protein [Roseivirga pacifica]MCO6379107.1 AAA domain-containing protein [Roseivirga pacifica]
MESVENENQASFSNRVDLTKLNEGVKKIKAEIGKVIVGQQQMVDLILTAILADGHILLEGVPGVAKTLASKLVSKSISVDYSRVQFTPDLMPSDVLGTSVFNMKNSEFEFKRGPVFANIVLIDEINRAPAKTQAALFEVMEEKQVTVDGNTYKMEAPYIVLATQNPIEQEGTYRLPEAQLDRFLFKIEIGYPNLEEETEILLRESQRAGKQLDEISAVLSAADILEYRSAVKQVLVDEKLLKYIAEIVNQTRHDSAIYLGASPRASLALLNGSRAFAALQGRDFVTPDDIKFLAPSVLKHRIILTPEKEMEGATPHEVISQLVAKTEVPR